MKQSKSPEDLQQPTVKVLGKVTPEELKVLQAQEAEKMRAFTELGMAFYRCLEVAQGVAQIENKRQMMFNGLGKKYEIPQFAQWSVQIQTGEIHATYPPGFEEQMAAQAAAGAAEAEADVSEPAVVSEPATEGTEVA